MTFEPPQRDQFGPDFRERPGAGGGAGGPAPTWRATVKSSRRVVVRPSPLGVGAAFVGAASVALVVVVYGAVEVDVLWSVLAGLAAVGVFVLTLRGFPLFGVLPLALSAFCWGLATRAWLPASATDVVGDLRFIGGNLAFVVPLVGAFLLAVALDAHRVSRVAVDEALSGRRWWGDAATRPAPLRDLEPLPAARFFSLAEGPCSHLVAVGRRVALVLPAAWPDGDYTVGADGRILRGGLVDAGASADLDGLVAALDIWQDRLKDTGATLRGFVMVSPAGSGLVSPAGSGGRVLLDVVPGQHLQIVHGHEFVEAAGGWLAAEPYRIDLAVTERLLRILADPAPEPQPGDVVPGRPAQPGRRRARTAGGASSSRRASGPTSAEPTPAEGARDLAPGWDSESAKRLADWASGAPPRKGEAPPPRMGEAPPPDTTEWWKDPPVADPSAPGRRREP